MDIIEEKYNFKSTPGIRRNTNQILLHHAAANCTPQDIHGWHLNNGWSGIGYHFVIAKDGSIYRGRPENWIGSHASGNNSNSIGICFVGNFEDEHPTAAQIAAGKELIAYLRGKYGNIAVKGHGDVSQTACPGRNFPMHEFTNVAAGGSANSVISDKGTTIRLGSKNSYVIDLQNSLNFLGYDCGNVDGDFGNKTLQALKTFQKINGLLVDGIAGQKTWDKLNNNPVRNTQPATTTNGYPGYLIKQGQKGDVVRKIQQRLLQLTYTSLGAADGDFGGKTTQAVRNFQKNRGLSIDGIVGEKTWNKLFG